MGLLKTTVLVVDIFLTRAIINQLISILVDGGVVPWDRGLGGIPEWVRDWVIDNAIHAEDSEDAGEKAPPQGTVPKEKLPNQGTVPGAPPVDAGNQGKHVPGHHNNDPNKSQWKEGETGVTETQEAWLHGRPAKGGTVVWDTGKVVGQNGETAVRVHVNDKGHIHGYPVNQNQYLSK
jgi:hypothetical protein